MNIPSCFRHKRIRKEVFDMKMNLEFVPIEVRRAAKRVKAFGGRALLVGGAVVDLLSGRDPDDWDLEVFGMSYADIEELFADKNPKAVGKKFGIVKITTNGIDIDLNVPRRDNKVGVGHSGFECQFDPRMSVKEAARRRDFTFNTLAADLSTGEIVNEWGGLEDLQEGILRATDPAQFEEDAVRALRAMDLLARKAKTVDPSTMLLIKSMHSRYSEIERDLVHKRWRSLLTKADKPSVGLEFLRESGWISWFPEVEALVECGQHPEWHPEGDVWIHSCLAADAAAQIRSEIPEHQREAFVFGVFLHDIGKPEMTITPQMVAEDKAPKELLWTARGHDTYGVTPAESFMRRLTDSKKLIKLVKIIVQQHMQPYGLKAGGGKKGAYARLASKMEAAGGDLRLIGRMCQCDSCATSLDWRTRSLATGEPNWEHISSQRVFDYAEEFDKDNSAVAPKLMGRDLIAAGLEQGPLFGKLLRKALDLQYGDSTLSKEELLEMVLPEE